jgi:hypothetical protein
MHSLTVPQYMNNMRIKHNNNSNLSLLVSSKLG